MKKVLTLTKYMRNTTMNENENMTQRKTKKFIAYSTLKIKQVNMCTHDEVNGLVIIFKCVALLVVFLLKGLFTKYVAKLAKGKSPKWYCCITAMDFEHCKIIHLFHIF